MVSKMAEILREGTNYGKIIINTRGQTLATVKHCEVEREGCLEKLSKVLQGVSVILAS
jgi:hypothetical protein